MELSIETAIPLPVGKLASGIVGTQKNARRRAVASVFWNGLFLDPESLSKLRLIQWAKHAKGFPCSRTWREDNALIRL